jgi:hypothetical protein
MRDGQVGAGVPPGGGQDDRVRDGNIFSERLSNPREPILESKGKELLAAARMSSSFPRLSDLPMVLQKTMPWLCLMSLLCLYACKQPIEPPASGFGEDPLPPAPDYAYASAWASLPLTADPADYTPQGTTPENQAEAEVDVFFIHPTTYRSSYHWNADWRDSAVNALTDKLPIKHQASVFNHSARIYAPRYRQMTYPGFFSPDKTSELQALDLAYQDIAAAFEYFLAHYHEDRPLIIASHSQGTIHGIRLVRAYIDGTPLQDQLVAAYLIGWPFPADTFAHLPVCETPGQTGCVISWCSWQEGHLAYNHDEFYQGSVVVNPLSWRTDTLLMRKDAHQGFVGRKFKRIHPERVTTQVHDGILWVSKPYPLMPDDNYHIGDYNLFWANMRSNIGTRVEAYLSAHPQAVTR